MAEERKNKTPQHKIDAAMRRYWQNRDEILAQRYERRKREKTTFEGDFKRLWKRSKDGAKSRGITFELDKGWLRARIEENGFCCEKTGIQFEFVPEPRHPFQMSIDRIDSSDHYHAENVQIVCLLYNLAKQSASDEDVYVFAEALIENSR